MHGREIPSPFGRGAVHASLWVGVAGLLLLAAHHRAVDLDVFHEMALVREALSLGFLPTRDSYAFTPTVETVVHHEWGSGAVFYALVVGAGWGWAGLSALRYALLFGIVAAAWSCARRRGADVTTALPLGILALPLLSAGLSPVRAQMFTYLFVALFLLILQLEATGRRRWVWLIPVIGVAWLNLHAGFVVGFGLFGLHALERFARERVETGSVRQALGRTRHLLIVGATLPGLVLLNPYGWEYVPFLARAITLPRPLIAEWAPLWDPRVEPRLVLFYAASLLFTLYAVLRGGGVRRLPGLSLVLVTAAFALLHQRHLPLYAIVWFACVPAYLARTELGQVLRDLVRRREAPIAALVAVVGIVAIGRTVADRGWELTVPGEPRPDQLAYPVGAVEYLRAHGFAGNLMTGYNEGSYVSWMLHPAVKVGLDSRYEVAYAPGVLEENRSLFAGEPGWDALLRKHDAHAVLIPRESVLESLLTVPVGPEQEAWIAVYRDDAYAVAVRESHRGDLPLVDRRTGAAARGELGMGAGR